MKKKIKPESSMTRNKIDDDNGNDCTVKKEEIMWKDL